MRKPDDLNRKTPQSVATRGGRFKARLSEHAAMIDLRSTETENPSACCDSPSIALEP